MLLGYRSMTTCTCVMFGLLRGLPTADIAQMLFISRHTLSDHMKAIFGKLEVSSRPELTALLLDQVLTTT